MQVHVYKGPFASVVSKSTIPRYFFSTHSTRLHRRQTTMYPPRAILCLLAALPALALAERCDVYVDGEVLRDLALPRADISAPPTVDLYVHIVAGSESREDGYLTVLTPDTTHGHPEPADNCTRNKRSTPKSS